MNITTCNGNVFNADFADAYFGITFNHSGLSMKASDIRKILEKIKSFEFKDVIFSPVSPIVYRKKVLPTCFLSFRLVNGEQKCIVPFIDVYGEVKKSCSNYMIRTYADELRKELTDDLLSELKINLIIEVKKRFLISLENEMIKIQEVKNAVNAIM